MSNLKNVYNVYFYNVGTMPKSILHDKNYILKVLKQYLATLTSGTTSAVRSNWTTTCPTLKKFTLGTSVVSESTYIKNSHWQCLAACMIHTQNSITEKALPMICSPQ